MEKYGFVYIWYDRKHKRYYIGCHWGTLDDGYISSSTWMKQGFRLRPNDFKRRILKTNVSRETLLEEEYKWLSQIKKEELGKRYYNVHNHHFKHWSDDNEKSKTVKEKLGVNRGRKFPNRKKPISFSNEHREKIRKNSLGENNPFYGKIPTQEHKQKIGDANKGKIPWNKGRKMSEETRKKLSDARRSQKGIKRGKYNMKSV
jgi:hypothetical protein